MKKSICLAFFTMAVVSLAACAKPSAQPAGETISPGDKIGDFLITTAPDGAVTYLQDLDCVYESNLDHSSCIATVGTNVNVTIGVYEDTYGDKFEEVWENYDYQLLIENRPVDLPAFGFIDFNQPVSGKVRYWNVVVSTNKPGKITVQISGTIQISGTSYGSFKATRTFVFKDP